MILYVVGLFIFLILLFFIYVRLKYRFWALQPVFHFYDIYYWFFNVGIIRHELPEKNRYTNMKQIVTKKYKNIDEIKLKECILLIQLNYFRNKENTYSPKRENIVSYFEGQENAFISYYSEPELLMDNRTNKVIHETKIIGVISSRPLHVIINIVGNPITFDVNYVDYLCVHKNHRNKNIAPQLIQTHEYNQSHMNKKICVSLFKREEELTGIVPLTVYETYCFDMKKWNQPQGLDASLVCLTCDKQNMFYLYNFLKETTSSPSNANKNANKNASNANKSYADKSNNKWSIVIYPEMNSLMELVVSKNLYIKMLMMDTNIVAVYFFRKTCTFIEKDKEIISCIGSVNHGLDTDVFVSGFKTCLWSIVDKSNANNANKTNASFKYLIVEDVSDNRVIIDNLSVKTHPFIVSPTAYFFYNFAYSPFKSDKCLIIL